MARLQVATGDWYCDYMDVGSRELKARLSEHVNRAADGEVVRITDRGVPARF